MISRKDIFISSQYHWWDYWTSFYKYRRDFYAGKLLDRTIDYQNRFSPKVIRGYALKRETKFLHSDDKSRFKFLDDVRYAGNYKTCVTSDTIYIEDTLKKIIGSIMGFPRMY